jgi:hypothetical protein
MLRLGATFRAATAIDHVVHGGIHGIGPIEVGPPHAWGRISIPNSMNDTNRQAKL